MIDQKKYKTFTAVVLIIAFMFYSDSFVFSQTQDDLAKAFQKAQAVYSSGQNASARTLLENLIEICINENIGKKDIIGKCYLLLGAVCEKENTPILAKENYRKAKDEHGITTIDGIDFKELPIYRQEILGEKNMIEQPGVPGSKKSPVIWIVASVVVVGVLAALLLKKKKKEQYTLTVTKGTGVDGSPNTGTTTYDKGASISYNYTLQSGYSNLIVQLDGSTVSASGTITMNGKHTLSASANANEVNFITDQDSLSISEGTNGSFQLKLSAQPTSNVTVTVSASSGDSDISVTGGSSLTFTNANWNEYQTVTLYAAEDSDEVSNWATIVITSSGITTKTITVSELDNDYIALSLLTPSNNETVSGTVPIQVEVSSPVGIQKVVFIINNEKTTVTTPPYTINWNTTRELDGPVIITVEAYNSVGVKKSITISVTVNN